MANSGGRDFVEAIAARDAAALAACLAPNVDFKGLTPGRFWEGGTPAEVVDVVLGHWFEEQDRIVSVAHVEEDDVVDTHRIGYRFDLDLPDGPHTVEQQAYFRQGPEGITHLRIVCSGFRSRS